MSEAAWAIVGAGSDLGVHVDGARRGPEQILQALGARSLERQLLRAPVLSKSRDPRDRAKNLSAVTTFNARVHDAVRQVIASGRRPLTLGGDHSVAIGSALAASDAVGGNLGLIWLDAHSDFHRLDTTITGNLHGVPLAVITGVERAASLSGFTARRYFSPRRTIIIGARSIDPPERKLLRQAGVRVIGPRAVRERGLTAVMGEAFAYAGRGTAGVHLSFDLDVINPRLAPGVSVPERGGLGIKQVQAALDVITRHRCELTSFDLVEYNPERDVGGRTLALALIILRQLFT